MKQILEKMLSVEKENRSVHAISTLQTFNTQHFKQQMYYKNVLDIFSHKYPNKDTYY